MRFLIIVIISFLTLFTIFLFYQDFKSSDIGFSPPDSLQCGQVKFADYYISQGVSYKATEKYDQVLDLDNYLGRGVGGSVLYLSQISDSYTSDYQDFKKKNAEDKAVEACRKGLISLGDAFDVETGRPTDISFSCKAAKDACINSGRRGCNEHGPVVDNSNLQDPQPDLKVDYDCSHNFFDVNARSAWLSRDGVDFVPRTVHVATFEVSCTCTVVETVRTRIYYGCTQCTEALY